MVIRPANSSDITALAELWHERIVLEQQHGQRLALLPDAAGQWQAAAAQWLADQRCRVLLAEDADGVVGYIVGRVETNLPGLAPAEIGVIVDLTVGPHSHQGGLGRRLLDPLRGWFVEQGIHVLRVQVSTRNPVEQAFWRASGAMEWFDVMWMRL